MLSSIKNAFEEKSISHSTLLIYTHHTCNPAFSWQVTVFFNNNSAEQGGGIYAETNSFMIFDGYSIFRNTAEYGKGIHVEYSRIASVPEVHTRAYWIICNAFTERVAKLDLWPELLELQNVTALQQEATWGLPRSAHPRRRSCTTYSCKLEVSSSLYAKVTAKRSQERDFLGTWTWPGAISSFLEIQAKEW